MLKGSIVALITPFDQKGAIDIPALEKLLFWHLESGTEGLVLCGSTGEGTSLSSSEKFLIFQTAKRIVGGKIPLVAATGTNVTAESAFLTKEAKRIGMDGCIAIVPYYLRPTPEGCIAHFAEIANVGLPLLIYHHPGRTGTKLDTETLLSLCEFSEVMGIKDATGDLNQVMDIIDQVPLFSGDDSLALAQFSIGFTGSISIVGNVIPKEWKHFVDLALQGNFIEARKLFYTLRPLIQAMVLETNPQCVKYALHVMDRCLPQMRLPLVEPREKSKNLLKELVQTAELALQ
jgi:4-hydroxy-tetrahydrodipicolinate synthase